MVALSAFKIVVEDTAPKDEILPNCKFISHKLMFVLLHSLFLVQVLENICFLILVVRHIHLGMVALKRGDWKALLAGNSMYYSFRGPWFNF